MQLFAILANTETFSARSRSIVELFLSQQVSSSGSGKYLALFDEHLRTIQQRSDAGKEKKRVSLQSVKVLRICTEINNELDQRQKYIVLFRLIEFVHCSGSDAGAQEKEFLNTVAEVFHIAQTELNRMTAFIASGEGDEANPENFLLLTATSEITRKHFPHVLHEHLQGELLMLKLGSADLMLGRYAGGQQLTVNGQPAASGSIFVFSQGSVIRGQNMQPVYFTDLQRRFIHREEVPRIVLTAEKAEYAFKNGKIGIHPVSFSASSGNLVGIMGGSGAGKSTLLHILNGTLPPRSGSIRINGHNVHKGNLPEGIIGFVPQDDLLIEELTVFQNLYYSARLTYGNEEGDKSADRVHRQLESLGLSEISNLTVGDPLNKMISGGQRKRLNIALELIRKPKVLFVDEPTSGLSSLDSEMVMDLLKQLALSGNLVFTVIHQPSSDIFKLFDKLLILDAGGFPVYFDNPSQALIYFKSIAGHADASSGECGACGNINPELVFRILEAKVMDEYGNPTAERKISPEEWNQHFKKNYTAVSIAPPAEFRTHPEPERSRTPWLRQLNIFTVRDLLSKAGNLQYLLINLLEAPLLAFILSFFLKYHASGQEYVFSENQNHPAFIFVSVLVALFMGLTVSAEEIFHDRKLLLRESFLHLSRSAYLFSKCGILAGISVIQTLSYVLIAHYVFGIHDMIFHYWLMLFSVSFFANMMGLILSASFRSVVTIYILIPILIIPQIILSGVLVKFEKLNPAVTNQARVPMIGELMVTRWAFEALAVHQFQNNRYEKVFFETNKKIYDNIYRNKIWLTAISDKLDSAYRFPNNTRSSSQVKLLQHELNGTGMFESPLSQIPVDLDQKLYNRIKSGMDAYRRKLIDEYKMLSSRKESIMKSLIEKSGGVEQVTAMEKKYSNQSLSDLVQNKDDLTAVIEHDHRLVQRFRPVYMDAPAEAWIRAPLYVSQKYAFGKYFNTYSVNLAVIWLMTSALYVLLYADGLKKFISAGGNLFNRIFSKS